MRIKAPGIYVQEKGLIERIGQYVYTVSDKFFLIIEKLIYEQLGSTIKDSLQKADADYFLIVTEGICTKKKAESYAEQCIGEKCGGVIGIGGGSVIDLAKTAAFYANIPLIAVPTLASSDAACSSSAVLYKEDGSFSDYLKLRKCPDCVLVDSEVIVSAPSEFLAAGMADALATYVENKAFYHAEIAGKFVKNTIPSTVMAISGECFELIKDNGKKALKDVRKNVCTDEVEKVIEANIYLSGVGFENGGLAAAHSVANGITHLKNVSILHGEAVAIGILAQMILQSAEKEEIEEMRDFLKALRLPVCLSQIGISDVKEDAKAIAIQAASCYKSNQSLLFSMRYEMIAGALIALETI